MASVTLGSRDMERFVADFQDIAPAHESAYAGRLKHLSRQGFPDGVGAGRGTPAQYDADQLFQMLVAMELAQFGVPPARQIKLVTEAWPRLRRTVLQVWEAFDAAERSIIVDVPPIFWRVPVEALRHMARTDRPYSPDASDTLDVVDADQVGVVMREAGYNVRRQAFIVGHQVVKDALVQLKHTTLGSHKRLASFMESMTVPADSIQSC